MPSLFEHHFKSALARAAKNMLRQCESNGTKGTPQHDFDEDVHRAQLTLLCKDIIEHNIDDAPGELDAFKEAIQESITAHKKVCDDKKIEKVATADTISTEIFTRITNQITLLFDNVRREMEQPHFRPYRDMDATSFISNKAGEFDFFHRYINIMLDYRIEKVRLSQFFDTKVTNTIHIEKYKALQTTLRLWTSNIVSRTHGDNFDDYKATIDACLSKLTGIERAKDTRTGNTVTGWIRGSIFAFVQTIRDLLPADWKSAIFDIDPDNPPYNLGQNLADFYEVFMKSCTNFPSCYPEAPKPKATEEAHAEEDATTGTVPAL